MIAAVGTNIQSKVEDQSFRNDLYYRLAVIRLDLPPLRYRIEDVPVIVEDFFERYGPELAEFGSTATSVSSAAMNQLCTYTFPGNVRELINTLRQAVAVATSDNVQVADLPAEITGSQAHRKLKRSSKFCRTPRCFYALQRCKSKSPDAFERQYLQDLLQRHQLNISKAAREAGIDRRHLYRLLEKYNIEIKERTVRVISTFTMIDPTTQEH